MPNSYKHPSRSVFLLACAALVASIACGCVRSTPVRTVQSYLQMLSGERDVTPAGLEALTTERYRREDHPHLASIAAEQRAQTLDLSAELREDAAIREFMQRVSWATTYNVVRQEESSALIVARVILTERRSGDRERALAIPNLPDPLADVLRRGLELPFQFELRLEDGKWKIDEFTIPAILMPLVEPRETEGAPESEPDAD